MEEAPYDRAGLVRCTGCALLFVVAGTAAEVREIYEGDYFEAYSAGEAYDADPAQRTFESRPRLALLLRHVSPPGPLLEIGSAGGYFLAAARDAGFTGTGVEPSPTEAEQSRRAFDLDVHTGFLEEAEFAPGSFGAACAWHVLEHIPEPVQALERVRWALKPGGVLLLEVPNVASVLARRRGLDWYWLDLEHHVAHHGPTSLRTALERAGFTDIQTSTVSALSYLRPARAMAPAGVAARIKEFAAVRAPRWREQPEQHEILRAVARAPTT